MHKCISLYIAVLSCAGCGDKTSTESFERVAKVPSLTSVHLAGTWQSISDDDQSQQWPPLAIAIDDEGDYSVSGGTACVFYGWAVDICVIEDSSGKQHALIDVQCPDVACSPTSGLAYASIVQSELLLREISDSRLFDLLRKGGVTGFVECPLDSRTLGCDRRRVLEVVCANHKELLGKHQRFQRSSVDGK